MTITKSQAKSALGITTDVALAQILGVTKQALTRIGEGDALPEGHQWQLMAKRPDLFPLPEAANDA